MAAKYDFKTSPDIQGEKEQPTLYPQIVVSGTKNLKDLAKDIARRSTVHEGTVVGLLCDLESIIANYLADGYNVKLGELGTFSATLTLYFSYSLFCIIFTSKPISLSFNMFDFFCPVSIET